MTLEPETEAVSPAGDGRTGTLYEYGSESGSLRRPPVFVVPSEDVLVVGVDLPLPTLRQRVAALPFAVEDMVSEPLANVHIAIGAEITPRRYVVGIVRHTIMKAWCAAVPVEAIACRIVPDVFALPAPENNGWAVMRAGDRALVRCADGTGFAIKAALLPGAWGAAGQPAVISYGDALPASIPATPSVLLPGIVDAALGEPSFDLRQGVYAAPSGAMPDVVRKAAFLVAAGAVLHCVVVAIDLFALGRIADGREAEARAVVQQILPGAPASGDVVETLSRLMPADTRPSGPQFLPLFAKATRALQPFASRTSVQSLNFSAADGGLMLTIEASDLATLQSLEQALREAGLDPVSGPATTDRGGAEFRVTVREGAG